MDFIDEKTYDKAELLPALHDDKVMNAEEFESLMKQMSNPVIAQKEMAVKLKHYLDKRIENELRTKGILSDHTRRWVESYNNFLDKIQKALYGEKSVNLHLHKVTHSQIAAKIREHE